MTVFLIIYGVLNVLVFALCMLNFYTDKIPGLNAICTKLKMNNPILRAVVKGLSCIVFLPATVLYSISLVCIAIIMIIIITNIDIKNHTTEEGDI